MPRKYGAHLRPAAKAAFRLGQKHGQEDLHQNPYSPNDFRHHMYEHGWADGYGAPLHGEDMGHGRGRKRRRRNRRNGVFNMWNIPHKEKGRAMSSVAGPMMPANRMVEPHRQEMLHRQLAPPEGRLFGVPGFVPGQPGWAGNAGVAQIPYPGAGGRGPGPEAVETYGSLGYASMGDGSMDMAVRQGSRRYGSMFDLARAKRKKRKK